MAKAEVLNVFCDERGQYGNPVALVEDLEGRFDAPERQAIAQLTGFSETVFINNVEDPEIRIFTPQQEIAFAGHAAVGAVHRMETLSGNAIHSLKGRDGRIQAWSDQGLTWVRTDLKSTPPWLIERLKSAEEVEALAGPQDPTQGYTFLWAWIDANAGVVRARTFAPDWGIPEDEANGSGCMRLACTIGQSLEIHHGKGSIVFARPGGPGYGDVGGRVANAGTLTVG